MPLQPTHHLVIANNGSLYIRSADSGHEGYYICQANNDIGAGLSKVIFLRVNGKFCVLCCSLQ